MQPTLTYEFWRFFVFDFISKNILLVYLLLFGGLKITKSSKLNIFFLLFLKNVAWIIIRNKMLPVIWWFCAFLPLLSHRRETSCLIFDLSLLRFVKFADIFLQLFYRRVSLVLVWLAKTFTCHSFVVALGVTLETIFWIRPTIVTFS